MNNSFDINKINNIYKYTTESSEASLPRKSKSLLDILKNFFFSDKLDVSLKKCGQELRKKRIQIVRLKDELQSLNKPNRSGYVSPRKSNIAEATKQIFNECMEVNILLDQYEKKEGKKVEVLPAYHSMKKEQARLNEELAKLRYPDLEDKARTLQWIAERIALQRAGLENENFTPAMQKLMSDLQKKIQKPESEAVTALAAKMLKQAALLRIESYKIDADRKSGKVLGAIEKLIHQEDANNFSRLDSKGAGFVDKLLALFAKKEKFKMGTEEFAYEANKVFLSHTHLDKSYLFDQSAITPRFLLANYSKDNNLVDAASSEGIIKVPEAFSKDFNRYTLFTLNGTTYQTKQPLEVENRNIPVCRTGDFYRLLEKAEYSSPQLAKNLSFLLHQGLLYDHTKKIFEKFLTDETPVIQNEEAAKKYPRYEVEIGKDNVVVNSYCFMTVINGETSKGVTCCRRYTFPREELMKDYSGVPLNKADMLPHTEVKTFLF